MNRLKRYAGACALALGALAGGQAAAAYPDRPVTVIVGFAPGGTNDILGRLMAAELAKRLGGSFVVENKPGANSMISANYVKHAKPDGYTLLVISSGGLTVNPAVYAPNRITYDPVKDFTPIALLAKFPLVVTTGAKLKDVKTIPELISLAKKSPVPLTHGVATSTFQLAAEVLGTAADVKFTEIPYKGSGPVVAALLGGQVDFAILDSAAVMPSVRAGRLNALAVTSAKRSDALPGIPTVDESGLPGFEVPIWTGLVAPAGTPKDVVQTLDHALAQILAEPDVKQKFKQLGMDVGEADSQVLETKIQDDIKRWTAAAKKAGMHYE
ncbi:tripartite tricarboxylate transporter substrate binding protein [Candidimonas humi]|uniref:Bug family tripartite tricarboxylate transporter substrate binding protein n=1 Tax=Candidimonas humi TaxID=683355 RepID=A0ABV8P2C8_9BURK|nr:tripartite tricarboxylate transporter substrate binding protein [Candidimonas humi]MBV6305562.1 tripartite tricarboxylate transporter substrate binding protein [Candidimonas humi]